MKKPKWYSVMFTRELSQVSSPLEFNLMTHIRGNRDKWQLSDRLGEPGTPQRHMVLKNAEKNITVRLTYLETKGGLTAIGTVDYLPLHEQVAVAIVRYLLEDTRKKIAEDLNEKLSQEANVKK